MTPRILVVEDDPNDALFLERAFRKAGLPGFDRVLPDGEEAIAYLDGTGGYRDRTAHPLPSHLLLDLKLPRVSGLEVLSWIRTSEGLRDLPVAILSSSGEPGDRVRATELGIDGYFIKPTKTAELVDVVQGLGRLWGLAAASA